MGRWLRSAKCTLYRWTVESVARISVCKSIYGISLQLILLSYVKGVTKQRILSNLLIEMPFCLSWIAFPRYLLELPSSLLLLKYSFSFMQCFLDAASFAHCPHKLTSTGLVAKTFSACSSLTFRMLSKWNTLSLSSWIASFYSVCSLKRSVHIVYIDIIVKMGRLNLGIVTGFYYFAFVFPFITGCKNKHETEISFENKIDTSRSNMF